MAEYEKRHSRRFPRERTMVKRMHTVRALRELIGGRCETEYAKRLLPHVRTFAEDAREWQTE